MWPIWRGRVRIAMPASGRTAMRKTLSGQAVALFNPRTQAWADHFQWSEQRSFEVEGITAHGRATVVRLQMNHPDLVSIRRLLAELGLPWRAEAPRER